MILMNGKRTNLENIFDAVNPGRPDMWRRVSDTDIGRSITDVLKEWVTQHSTFYYLRGERVEFDLR